MAVEKMKIIRSKTGFTLLEVLAALSVLGISLLVLLQTDGLNATRILHASRLFDAVQIAGEQMENVFASGGEGLHSDEEQTEDGIYSWERIVSDTEFAGLKEVRLTVRWKEGEREESYVALAYLPN